MERFKPQATTPAQYEVIDARTGCMMGQYVSHSRAIARADKLDIAFGAVRYYVRLIGSKQYSPRFIKTIDIR